MLEHTLDAEHGVLYLTPHGSLAAEDFVAAAAEVDPYLEATVRLKGLMVVAEKFPGWSSFSTLAAHLRFVRDHHQKIGRVAIVSDSEVLTALPSLAKHFVQAEVKHFAAAARDEAEAWLRAGPDA